MPRAKKPKSFADGTQEAKVITSYFSSRHRSPRFQFDVTAAAGNHPLAGPSNPFVAHESRPDDGAPQATATPLPIAHPDLPEDDRLEGEVTQVVASASIFPESVPREVSDVSHTPDIDKVPETQIITVTASFSGSSIGGMINIGYSSVSAQVKATQIVRSKASSPQGFLQGLSKADLGNIQISPEAANNDGDGDYEKLETIRADSEIAEPDAGDNREPEVAPSMDKSIKSWASGSLTTSMRKIIGLRPKPLSHRRVRPQAEDLGPPPPRWPCHTLITHHTGVVA